MNRYQLKNRMQEEINLIEKLDDVLFAESLLTGYSNIKSYETVITKTEYLNQKEKDELFKLIPIWKSKNHKDFNKKSEKIELSQHALDDLPTIKLYVNYKLHVNMIVYMLEEWDKRVKTQFKYEPNLLGILNTPIK